MANKLEWWKIETEEDCKKVIGKIVYEHYTPSRVGKVIDCGMGEAFMDLPQGRISMGAQPVAKVKWLKQTKKYPDQITEIQLSRLNDFTALMLDHKRKYDNHLKTYERILEEL
jgi:hypothetical protein